MKVFLLLLMLAGCTGLGMLKVKRVTDRRKMLYAFAGSIKGMKNAMVYQGMTMLEALAYIGRNGMEPFFSRCAAYIKEHPSAGGTEIVLKCWSVEDRCTRELEEEDKLLIARFMEAMIDTIMAQEVSEVCSRYLLEVNERIKDIGEKQLKKAKLMRTMYVLAGACAAVILV